MQEKSNFDELTPGGLGAAAVGAAAGTAVDLAVFPGAGSAVGFVANMMINFMGRGLERRHAKALAAVDAACNSSDTSAEELFDRAGRDDERIELTMKALSAAAQTANQAKVRALGRALANGVLTSDDAILDQEGYIVDALSRLEAPHVKVLDILSASRIPQLNGVTYKRVDLAWPIPAIAVKYPKAGAMMPSILATLVSIGAVSDIAIGAFGGVEPTHEANDFGKLLLARLREAEAEPD